MNPNMKSLLLALFIVAVCSCNEKEISYGIVIISSPDGNIAATISDTSGKPTLSITHSGITLLEDSPLGLETDFGDLSRGLKISGRSSKEIDEQYCLPNIKTSQVHYIANETTVFFCRGKEKEPSLAIQLRVSDNDAAFRYLIIQPSEDTKICRVMEEATTYAFPKGTTTFLCPQMKPMTGFARTTPSYETPYEADLPTGSNGLGYGYTYPCLFKVKDKGWVLISETGVDGSYCGSHLCGQPDGRYRVTYPHEKEFGGNGTSEPGVSFHKSPDAGLDGAALTPWRTITLGRDLRPIAETTVAWDLVKSIYAASKEYTWTKGSWSWIIKMDESITYECQKEYIDFSSAMGWETVLVDNWWDTKIGRNNIEELASYAKSKGVSLFLWYNSNGYWNDAPQSPRDKMHSSSIRRSEMAWLERIGIKGIKVDFFGSDKQLTMQLYQDILSDANDFGLEVVFHGCTLPRGWERMFPNFASAEAVLASENLHFFQERCDSEAFQATFLPFTRNTLASMDFGGSALNKVYNATNDSSLPGTIRKTTDNFALATAVLFQSPVQHFALAPNNLKDAPAEAIEFMKNVPTTWDETHFIDGYPGKFVVMARRKGERWFVAGINAGPEPYKLTADKLPMISDIIEDIEIAPNDGLVIVR